METFVLSLNNQSTAHFAVVKLIDLSVEISEQEQ